MLARQIVIGFGIALILPLLIHYGVSTFHPAPKYSAFITARISPGSNATADEKQSYLDQQRREREAYESAARDFARALAKVAIPLGVVALVAGALLPATAIGTGLIAGGILTITWGYWRYWDYIDDSIRFVSLLIGFILLLLIGFLKTKRTRTATPS